MIQVAYDPDTGQFEAVHLPTGCASCAETVDEAVAGVLDALDVYRATIAEEYASGIAGTRPRSDDPSA